MGEIRSGCRVHVEWTVQSATWGPRAERLGQSLVGRFAAAAKLAAPSSRFKRTVSLLLCDDEVIRPLNRDHLGRDRPTDVLSFPSGEEAFLGDIAISVETADGRIGPGTWVLEDEVLFLWIHGVLHLLGHDHERDEERAVMEAEEQRIWTVLGRTGTLRGPSEDL